MKVVIVLGGACPSYALLKEHVARAELLIAADRGGEYLRQYGFRPHLIVGDFDSLTTASLDKFRAEGVKIQAYPVQKDWTDGQLALKSALVYRPSEIVFLGALGGERLDHLLVSLGLLDCCLEQEIPASIQDDAQQIFLTQCGLRLSGQCGQLFSLQAYNGPVIDLSISQAKYQLENYLLRMGDGRTLANEFTESAAEIKFKLGKLLVIIHHR